jgi:hypothetical protein
VVGAADQQLQSAQHEGFAICSLQIGRGCFSPCTACGHAPRRHERGHVHAPATNKHTSGGNGCRPDKVGGQRCSGWCAARDARCADRSIRGRRRRQRSANKARKAGHQRATANRRARAQEGMLRRDAELARERALVLFRCARAVAAAPGRACRRCAGRRRRQLARQCKVSLVGASGRWLGIGLCFGYRMGSARRATPRSCSRRGVAIATRPLAGHRCTRRGGCCCLFEKRETKERAGKPGLVETKALAGVWLLSIP